MTNFRPRNCDRFCSRWCRIFRFLVARAAENCCQFLVKKRWPFSGRATSGPAKFEHGVWKTEAIGATPNVRAREGIGLRARSDRAGVWTLQPAAISRLAWARGGSRPRQLLKGVETLCSAMCVCEWLPRVGYVRDRARCGDTCLRSAPDATQARFIHRAAFVLASQAARKRRCSWQLARRIV